MNDYFSKIDGHFNQWYDQLTNVQQYTIDQFLRGYNLHSIENDVVSFARDNDIEAIVPECVCTRVVLADGEMRLIESTYHVLTSSTDEIFKLNLRGFFHDIREQNKTRKISFYCMLPVYMRDNSFGIHGVFLISD